MPSLQQLPGQPDVSGPGGGSEDRYRLHSNECAAQCHLVNGGGRHEGNKMPCRHAPAPKKRSGH